MSTQSASFHRIVVEDVIKSIREDFINEGVDEQVLEDLKQLWESKLVQAGVYDFPNQAPVHGYAYDLNNYNYLDTSHSAPSTLLPSLPNQLYSINTYLANAPNPSSRAGLHSQALNTLRSLNPPPTSSLQSTTPTNYAYDSSKPQTYLPPPTSTTNWTNSNTLPTLPPINTQYQPPPNIKQQDGASDEMDPALERKKIDAILMKKYVRAQKLKQQMAKMTAASNSTTTTTSDSSIPQFDGLGDRKAKDEDDDDDDDDDAGNGDEELGSDLDDDDDEEEPDTEHIVLCQYEKVTRVKNKRKANLKDGIMHINGKDYVFSRATGEFDW